MTDERAALIERLELMAIAEADTTAELIEDGADADVIACSREEAQFFASCAAEIARLSEKERYERARADKAVLQLEGTRAEFRDFDDTVRRHGLSLSALNAAREEARALREALEPFANAWNDEMFLWSRDDLQRFMAEGIPMSNPRYGDNTPVYCVIEPGEDHEDRSDDYLFTVGDLRRAALARANGEAE